VTHPNQLIGKTDFDFFPPEDARKYGEDDRKVLGGERILEEEEETNLLENKTGDPSRYSRCQFVASDGEIVGVQAVFWIARQKKAMERQKRRTDEGIAHRVRAASILPPEFLGMERDRATARDVRHVLTGCAVGISHDGVDSRSTI